MRPLTFLVGGLAAASLVLLGVFMFKLRRHGDPQADVETTAAAEADGGSGVGAGGRSWSSLARMRGRSVPRFQPAVAADEPARPSELRRPGPPALAPPAPADPSKSGRWELPEPDHVRLRKEASRDGFLYREAGSSAVYVVQNGTKFHVPSMDEFKNLGLNPNNVREVPPGSLPFLADRPPERSLFMERGDPHVYYFENGQKRWVPSHEVFARQGFRWEDVRTVPNGTLSQYSDGTPVQ
jgi:hypothetical protein